MELLMLVSAIALLQFWGFGLMVGRARGLYDVPAPLTSGHEIFDRWFRVHYNTMERLVILIPTLFAFGYLWGQYPAAGLGAIYLVGRQIYALQYVRDPESRGLGMLIGELPLLVLMLGSVVGAIVHVIG